jgi:hypothetical protein
MGVNKGDMAISPVGVSGGLFFDRIDSGGMEDDVSAFRGHDVTSGFILLQ